jgi:hypothetical protein
MLPALAANTEKKSSRIRAFTPFLDTLIPADLTPSASQLNVHKHIISGATKSIPLQRVILLGCKWLDEQANNLGFESFEKLSQKLMNEIVARAESSLRRSIPRAFFDTIRNQALGYYYAQAGSWKGLAYARPPQPRGFPDHKLAPGESDLG